MSTVIFCIYLASLEENTELFSLVAYMHNYLTLAYLLCFTKCLYFDGKVILVLN
jgi:hypothetical protein